MNLKRFGFRTLLILCLLAPVRPAAALAQGGPVVAGWNYQLERAVAALREGDWKRGRNIARNVLGRMCDLILEGDDVEKALGLTLTLLAVGEAGLGEEPAARWHWQAARQLYPEAARIDLAPFGAPGAWLAEQPQITRPAMVSLPMHPVDSSSMPPGAEIQAPKKKRAALPKYPAAMLQHGRQVKVVVSAVIDQLGDVTSPQILESAGAPTMVLATLEAIRTWKFEPARLNGQPVKVFYTVNVSFGIR